MIECSCACDIDFDGTFVRFDASVREYRTCGECGGTIWPWEVHTVGLWWDCDCCDQYDDDCGCDEWCPHDLEATSKAIMCETCTRAMDQLLCGCWRFRGVWQEIAERNEMTVQECLG